MIVLILLHLLILMGALFVPRRFSMRRLYAFCVPVLVGFFYVSLWQVADAVQSDKSALDPQVAIEALTVSLWAATAFVIGYAVYPAGRSRLYFEGQFDYHRIQACGAALVAVGLAGLAIFVSTVGGASAFFGLTPPEINPFQQLSAYVYNLPHLTYAGIALLGVALVHKRASRWGRLVFWFSSVLMIVVALNHTDRSDIIRAVLPVLVVWSLTHRGGEAGRSVWGTLRVKLVFLLVAALIGAGVVMLPFFRDTGRHLFTSNVSFRDALMVAVETRGASRFSATRGGEFDSGARLVYGVNNGNIRPPGPVHIAHVVWGFVPRSLVPDKHERFSEWAGADHLLIQSAASYNGSSLSGWGEAHAYLGGIGAALYWFAFGFALRRLEEKTHYPGLTPILASIVFLPLAQYVVMGFWAGSMNTIYVVLPVLAVLRYAHRPPRSNRQSRQAKYAALSPARV